MKTLDHTAAGMQAKGLEEIARSAGELTALPGTAMPAHLEAGSIKDASLKLELESPAEHLKLSQPVSRSMTADIETMILTLPGGTRS